MHVTEGKSSCISFRDFHDNTWNQYWCPFIRDLDDETELQMRQISG